MTKEEAITKYIIPALQNTWNEKKCKEIIEALEQEPCNDAIINIVDSYSESQSNVEDVTQDIISDIMVLPPVTPQPMKIGKWIEERTYMECPNCHDIWHYQENQTERFKFCPTCGGKN